MPSSRRLAGGDCLQPHSSASPPVGSGAPGPLFDLGFGSNFYTPIIVGLVLTLVLALVATDDPAAAKHPPWRGGAAEPFDYLLDPANWRGLSGIWFCCPASLPPRLSASRQSSPFRSL
jgi:hypothetical protein